MTALYLFVFLGLFSPGPNVILLTASGARFGLRRTLPHIFGVALGVGVTSAITGFGVGAIIIQFPMLRMVLSILAALWIFYMAFHLWNAARPQSKATDRPFTFIEAILFQWVNPKVWAVALAAMAYLPGDVTPAQAALSLGHAFAGINLFVCLFWTSFGHLLSHILQTPSRYQIFLRVMAALLFASVPMIFL